MALAVLDVLKARLASSEFNQFAINVKFLQVTGVTAPIPTEQDVANTLDSFMGASLKPLMTSDASWYGAAAQKVFPSVGLEFTSNAHTGAGTAGTNPLPSQTCGLLKLSTFVAGRRQRGRMYVPFPDEVFNDVTNRPTAAYLVLLNNLGAGLLNPFSVTGVAGGTATLSWGMWNGISGFRGYSFGAARDFWATQRRRSFAGRTDAPPW